MHVIANSPLNPHKNFVFVTPGIPTEAHLGPRRPADPADVGRPRPRGVAAPRPAGAERAEPGAGGAGPGAGGGP